MKDRRSTRRNGGVGLVAGAMLAMAGAGVWAGNAADEAGRSAVQLLFSCQILEMPQPLERTLFGAKGALPGGDVTDDLLQRLPKTAGLDVLSAPRITARAGESAQIKIGQGRSFTTSFRVVSTNGAWEPVQSQHDLGVSVTVTGTPYPQDPERIRGAAQIALSELASVSEQTVTPPGQKTSIKLESPAIQKRELTTTFDVRSGKTIVLGGVEKSIDGKVTTTVVLLKVDVESPARPLVETSKGLVIPELQLVNAALSDVATYLMAQSRELDPAKKGINIVIQGGRTAPADTPTPTVTLSMRNVALYDVLRFVSQATGATVEYDPSAVILRLP